MTFNGSLEFPLAKAQYLFNHATEPGSGGDKRKFWREVMGFESPEAIREAVMTQISRLFVTVLRTERLRRSLSSGG